MTDNAALDWVVEQEFLRKQLAVTIKDYRDAVTTLVSTAQGDGSGARAAAQVLLSLYSSAFPCDLTKLLGMDTKNQLATLTAIRGRLCTFEEPHCIIDNGDAIFDELKQRWRHIWQLEPVR